jgi:hypothetical protein
VLEVNSGRWFYRGILADERRNSEGIIRETYWHYRGWRVEDGEWRIEEVKSSVK